MRAKVGLVAHATFLYPALTVRENLGFAGRLYGVSRPAARADTLLSEHGLEDWAEVPAGTLSRGLAQRVAIARGLVHDPPILLLDEPFSGLDARSADRLADCLQNLRQRERAIVLASHDLERAAMLSDRALVLRRGRVALDAGSEALSAGALERAVSDAAS
jgi:ABC-type multidrug transport system ATPase subunit